jgi:Clr5 domain
MDVEAQGLHTPSSMQHEFSFSRFLEEEEEYNRPPMYQNNSPWNPAILPYRSREPSVASPETTESKHPSPQDWDNIRPIFTKLYSTEDRKLKDVKSILERNHGFVAK